MYARLKIFIEVVVMDMTDMKYTLSETSLEDKKKMVMFKEQCRHKRNELDCRRGP